MTQGSTTTGELVARVERAETDLAYAKQALDRETARAIKFGKEITTLERELEEARAQRDQAWSANAEARLDKRRETARANIAEAEVERLKAALNRSKCSLREEFGTVDADINGIVDAIDAALQLEERKP